MAIFVAAGLFMSACGGGGSTGGPITPPKVSIVISPSSASAVAGQPNGIQFTATVQGSSDTSVVWSVNGVTGGNSTVGTVSATGLYAAPAAVPNPATVTVTAISQADSTKSASAIVTITAPVSISVGPEAASAATGETVQFTATVKGSSNTAVTWSVNGVTGGNGTVGTVSATGLYTAPAAVPNPATVTVTATSQADSSKSASAVVTVTPAPTPMAVLNPTSLSFGDENVGGLSAPKTVVLSNTGDATLNIASITLTGTDSGDFTEASGCGSTLAAGGSCNIALSFQPTASGTRSATLTVNDNATGSPQTASLTGNGVVPTLTINPTSRTVAVGDQITFALNAQSTCESSLFGSMAVSGSGNAWTVTYTVPQALPSSWNDTLTCMATDGGSKALAAITLVRPTPVITGSAALGGSLGTLWAYQPFSSTFTISGSGFFSDSTLKVSNNPPIVCGINQIAWNQIQLTFGLNYNDGFGPPCGDGTSTASWDPGFISFSVSDPAGNGGGTSNTGYFAFLGDQNLMASDASYIYQLVPIKSEVLRFNIADGSPAGSFTFSPGTGLSISVDDVTHEIVVFTSMSVEAFDPITLAKVYELDAASPASLQGGTAGGGWAVFSAYDGTEGIPDVMDAINLKDPGNPPNPAVHVHYNGTPQDMPWNFQIATINKTPTEVVWSAEYGVLSTVDIASQTVINSITMTNIFTFAKALSTTSDRGGWQLQVFNNGPRAGTAVLLSQFDQVLVYVDLATMTETKRVNLTASFTNANPPLPILQSFRLGKDEADGSVVVAFADSVNGKTILYNVAADGTMSKLNASASFLAVALQESSDGTKIYWGNHNQFAIAPKQ